MRIDCGKSNKNIARFIHTPQRDSSLSQIEALEFASKEAAKKGWTIDPESLDHQGLKSRPSGAKVSTIPKREFRAL